MLWSRIYLKKSFWVSNITTDATVCKRVEEKNNLPLLTYYYSDEDTDTESTPTSYCASASGFYCLSSVLLSSQTERSGVRGESFHPDYQVLLISSICSITKSCPRWTRGTWGKKLLKAYSLIMFVKKKNYTCYITKLFYLSVPHERDETNLLEKKKVSFPLTSKRHKCLPTSDCVRKQSRCHVFMNMCGTVRLWTEKLPVCQSCRSDRRNQNDCRGKPAGVNAEPSRTGPSLTRSLRGMPSSLLRDSTSPSELQPMDRDRGRERGSRGITEK